MRSAYCLTKLGFRSCDAVCAGGQKKRHVELAAASAAILRVFPRKRQTRERAPSLLLRLGKRSRGGKGGTPVDARIPAAGRAPDLAAATATRKVFLGSARRGCCFAVRVTPREAPILEMAPLGASDREVREHPIQSVRVRLSFRAGGTRGSPS